MIIKKKVFIRISERVVEDGFNMDCYQQLFWINDLKPRFWEDKCMKFYKNSQKLIQKAWPLKNGLKLDHYQLNLLKINRMYILDTAMKWDIS